MSVADWIVSKLKPWDRDGTRLWSFMPEEFEAYARVFHPPFFGEHFSDDILKTWAEVGAEHGVGLSPNVSLEEVLGLDPFEGDVYVRPREHPADGELPSEICHLLVEPLTPHTSTPDVCWFCVWHGLGVFQVGTPLTQSPPSRAERKGSAEATGRSASQSGLDPEG